MEKKDIQVVMLAAGKGQRFKDAGCEVPKPIIKLKNGNCMFEEVMDKYQLDRDDSTTYIYTQSFDVLRTSNVRMLKATPVTFGPADSAMRALGLLAANEAPNSHFKMNKPVLFLDCDSFSECDVRQLVADTISESVAKERVLLAGALVFDPAVSKKEHFSCVWMNRGDHTRLSSMAERRGNQVADPDWAGAGGYFFVDGYEMLAAVAPVVEDHRYRGEEAHLSAVLNHMCNEGHDLGIVQVPNFTCIGTPEELRVYEGIQ